MSLATKKSRVPVSLYKPVFPDHLSDVIDNVIFREGQKKYYQNKTYYILLERKSHADVFLGDVTFLSGI